MQKRELNKGFFYSYNSLKISFVKSIASSMSFNLQEPKKWLQFFCYMLVFVSFPSHEYFVLPFFLFSYNAGYINLFSFKKKINIIPTTNLHKMSPAYLLTGFLHKHKYKSYFNINLYELKPCLYFIFFQFSSRRQQFYQKRLARQKQLQRR